MNLINILSKCIGQTFYTTIFGYVTIAKVEQFEEDAYPITLYYNGSLGPKTQTWVTKEGHFSYNSDTECIIFPSKEQRDWKVFKQELNKKK